MKDNPDEIFDNAVNSIREDAPDPKIAEAAASRVWARVNPGTIRGCADFRALLPEFHAGKLSEARMLLVQDHLRECVACRKADRGVTPSRVAAMPAARALPHRFWAIAAGVVLVAGIGSWAAVMDRRPVGSRVVVHAADAGLYRIEGNAGVPVKTGDEIPGGAEIRTAGGSGAVLRMTDGSLVEVRERSQLTVRESRSLFRPRDYTVEVAQGGVIVQAAKRTSGHLYVKTRDCNVAVTGTVFGVASGLKGSRVSVVEGEVHVAHRGDKKVLRAGQQYSSDPSMEPVPVEQDIAWSRNRDAHMALLKEFSVLGKSLADVRLPQPRFASRLTARLPAETVVFVSLPNLGQALGDAQQVIRARLDQSPVLREWWEQHMEGRHGGPKMQDIIDKVRTLSGYIGDEVIVAAIRDERGRVGAPVVLAEVKKSGIEDFIQAEMTKLGVSERERSQLPIEVSENVLKVSPHARSRGTVALTGGFENTALYRRIAPSYREGAGFLFAADLEGGKMLPREAREGGPVPRFQHVVVEQKEVGGAQQTRATLSFAGKRTGVAAWLAEPAPLRVLDFFSADAAILAAFAVTSPSAAFDEVLAWATAKDPNAPQELAKIEAELGFNLRNDLATALGSEFAVGLDGPAIPVPSVKLVAEVYSPARVQFVIQKVVEQANRRGVQDGVAIQLTEQPFGGRVYYTLNAQRGPLSEVHYTFVNGYLIAATSRALVDKGIETHGSGLTISRSAKFTGLLPRDRHNSLSGVVYQNLGPTLAPIMELMPPENRQAFGGMSADMKATLVAVYAGPDSIQIASSGSLLGLSADNLLTGGPLGMLGHLG
ncbi:MAG: FecR domain-containing protein, partial [Bryobacteraceae bacterium]